MSNQDIYDTEIPEGWQLDQWRGDLGPTQEDLDFVEQHEYNNTVVGDFVRRFGAPQLPWVEQTPVLPKARPPEADMTPEQIQELDNTYPDSTQALSRDFLKKFEKQLEELYLLKQQEQFPGS